MVGSNGPVGQPCSASVKPIPQQLYHGKPHQFWFILTNGMFTARILSSYSSPREGIAMPLLPTKIPFTIPTGIDVYVVSRLSQTLQGFFNQRVKGLVNRYDPIEPVGFRFNHNGKWRASYGVFASETSFSLGRFPLCRRQPTGYWPQFLYVSLRKRSSGWQSACLKREILCVWCDLWPHFNASSYRKLARFLIL